MGKGDIGIPGGTRDFSPEESFRRKYIINNIEQVFQKYGFLPIETPAMENRSTLTGKYGEEGDKLIYNVLNSGTFIKNITTDQEATKRWELLFNEARKGTLDINKYYEQALKKDLPRITNKALRYDLTVPFARYVVMHQHEITYPFKRYQIQPVWRADRPQKGRYREFTQCDADIIGSNSLLNELELVQMFDEVFTFLRIPDFSIKINNRKVLAGIAEAIGVKDFAAFTIIVDKLEKIGIEKVEEELKSIGIGNKQIDALNDLLLFAGLNKEKLDAVSKMIGKNKAGQKGIKEMQELLNLIHNTELSSANVEFDIKLARGLDYYTGTIFEVSPDNTKIGAIAGGGRYDDLTGVFGLKDVSGVGISFGVDRIYDVMAALDLFPNMASLGQSTKILFVNFGKEEAAYCLKLLAQVRSIGIPAELYPDEEKVKKQMAYADKKKIPYVLLVGTEEMKNNKITVKDMKSGKQENLSLDEFLTSNKFNLKQLNAL